MLILITRLFFECQLVLKIDIERQRRTLWIIQPFFLHHLSFLALVNPTSRAQQRQRLCPRKLLALWLVLAGL